MPILRNRVRPQVLYISLGISILLNALLLPLIINEHLRSTYRQTIAHWSSKISSPPTVFLGDSITAGGGHFNDLRTINLASNGLQTYQISANLSKALSYDSDRIVVMAGTNDAVEGPIDRRTLKELWTSICAEPRVVVTLPPPSNDTLLNSRLEEISEIASEVCAELERPVISLTELLGHDGLIKPQYTTDGVHLTDDAYSIWREELQKLGL